MGISKKSEFHTSGAKIEIVRNKNPNIIRKSFTGNTSKLEFQYAWLLKHQHLPFIPKVFNSKKDHSFFSYDMEYYQSYRNLSDIFLSVEKLELKTIENLITRLLDALAQIHVNPKTVSSKELAEKYIREKVLDKINFVAKECSDINTLMKAETMVVNGQEYKGWPEIENRLLSDQTIEILSRYRETEIHGDFTLENILLNDSNEMMILDPNNENYISSPHIDYAKLMQSFHSQYENLCKLSEVSVTENKIEFEKRAIENLEQSYLVLKNVFEQRNELSIVLLHEAIHFSRLLPYRIRISKELTPLFFGMMIKNFNEVLFQEQLEQTVIQ